MSPLLLAAREAAAVVHIHFKTVGVRVGEKVFAYDPVSRTLGIRYKFKQLCKAQGWLFENVSSQEWKKFCENPEAASRLAYWFERGKIISSTANITVVGIWNCKQPQLPLPMLPLQGDLRKVA